jgi:UDP-N-acetylglucosamine acyltransferase
MIDPKAVVDSSAKIGANVTIGSFSVIGPDVEIGEGTKIASHVLVAKNTRIGKKNLIYDFAAIGGDPQDITVQTKETYLEIGDSNVFREFCTINRGSNKVATGGTTRIGNQNLFMAYTHVAHDCIVGSGTIFANNASLAGHVLVDDYANLAAFAGVHQFCRIGSYTYLGRATKVSQDILPYMLVTGNPGTPVSLNLVGLKRFKVSRELMRVLKHIYHLLYRRDLKFTEIRENIAEMAKTHPEINLFLEMVDTSQRGIARPKLRRSIAEVQPAE